MESRIIERDTTMAERVPNSLKIDLDDADKVLRENLG